MAYATVDDLLIGDLTLGSGARPDKYVDDAADEIDSVLGYRYVLPLDPEVIPSYAMLLLKRCANFLASGRLIMALAVGGEDTAMHAYGLSLVQEGQALLAGLAGAAIDIPGATPVDPVLVGRNMGPSIVNQDASSGLDEFYAFVNGSSPVLTWTPGAQTS